MSSENPDPDIAYLNVFNAHNGELERIRKPIRYHTLNEFKNYIYERFTDKIIGNVSNIFLLTSFGIKVNFNIINELEDVFVFDKRLFSLDLGAPLVESYISQRGDTLAKIQKPKPSALKDVDSFDVKTMTNSMKVNDGWSRSLYQDSMDINQEIKSCIKNINVIFKSLSVIFQFISSFINDNEKSFSRYYNYIKLLSIKTLHKNWKKYYNNLSSFPPITFKKSKNIKLFELLDQKKLAESSEFVGRYLPDVVKEFNTMSSALNSVNEDKWYVNSIIEQLRNESISKFKDSNESLPYLVDEISLLQRSISDDIQKLLRISTSSLTEIYHRHKNEYSPNIFSSGLRLYQLLESLQDYKSKLAHTSLLVFGKIADLQLKVVNVKDNLKEMVNPSDPKSQVTGNNAVNYQLINEIKSMENYLSLCIDLPLVFGFMIIEKRRQLEWYDFFSKGMVGEVSEQLTATVNHERIFRQIWLKKFGNFASLINYKRNSNSFIIKLPNLDISLINPNIEEVESPFSIFENVSIEREDIENYIEMLKKYVNINATISTGMVKSTDVLEKNYKELLKMTSSMKKSIKVISSLSSFTSPLIAGSPPNEKSPPLNENLKSEDIPSENISSNDNDLKVISGMKSRIRKLENLLHHEQYKDISNWPVVLSSTSNKDAKDAFNGNLSLLVSKDFSTKSPHYENENNKDPRQSGTLPQTNSQLRMMHPSSIDKHLTNIRLKKHNQELLEENGSLKSVNNEKDEIIRKLREELSLSKDKTKEDNEKHESLIESKDKCIAELNTKIETSEMKKSKRQDAQVQVDSKNLEIKELDAQVKLNAATNSELNDALLDLRNHVSHLKRELEDTEGIKKDLFSNMSSKESETLSMRVALEDEVKQMRSKYDELSEDYENLIDFTQTEHKNVENIVRVLNKIIVVLLLNILNLGQLEYTKFLEFCLILESMGLLLSKDYNSETKNYEFKITRVKGLRQKKNHGDSLVLGEGPSFDETTTVASTQKRPISNVVGDVDEAVKWTADINLLKNLPEEDDADGVVAEYKNDYMDVINENSLFENEMPSEINKVSEFSVRLARLVDSIFRRHGETNSKFDIFVDVISFRSRQPQAETLDFSSEKEGVFLNAISKRFSDVEQFAKKLTKENKMRLDVDKVSDKLKKKITTNNFQVGDYVLFLPTRIEKSSVQNMRYQPWAAFNLGAPHYFLRLEDSSELSQAVKERDWLVGRILNIQKNVVTKKDVEDSSTNPFQLAAGVVWYLVDAEKATQ